MPNPVPNSASEMHFNDAPGGDMLFDELFPPEGQVSNATPAPTTPAAAAPPATTQPEYFLKNSTGSVVYKDAAEALKGIEHKDALIEKLRTEAIARTGVDPVTGQPIRKADPAQQPVNYLEDDARYFNDLKDAVDKGDRKAYLNAQTKLIFDALAPVAPVLHNFAKSQAVDQVSGEIKDFRTFLETDDYKSSLEAMPSLKQAITQAESNYAYASQLPELYRLAYYASVGKKGPIVVQNPTPTPQPRPTLHASTPPPPEPTTVTEGLNTSSGRKAMIERMERQGIGNVRW
jgi:hypothetical protein